MVYTCTYLRTHRIDVLLADGVEHCVGHDACWPDGMHVVLLAYTINNDRMMMPCVPGVGDGRRCARGRLESEGIDGFVAHTTVHRTCSHRHTLRNSFDRTLPLPYALPVERQSKYRARWARRRASSVGRKNILSSSGWAITSKTLSIVSCNDPLTFVVLFACGYIHRYIAPLLHRALQHC